MMTEKIYYEDVYCKTFEAEVVSCRSGKKGYEIVLDRTAFYPEGGGQPGDTGMLFVAGTEEKVSVLDTREKNEEIWHVAEKPIEPGCKVRGEIDWENRFDLMQNHSGEHIVSGLIHQAFGYQNVGFHMGKDVITIDFDGEITEEQMEEIEKKANAVVWANRPVEIVFYTEEEVKEVEYRSKKELHGMVRIVTFPGADVCACCGTHVERTGEIGLIKLISVQKHKEGVRMEMLSGRKAFEYVLGICKQNQQISVALSAKPTETAAAVDRTKEAMLSAQYRAVAMELKVFDAVAKEMTGAGDVVLFEDQLSADGVRKLAVQVMETCGGRCIVLSGNEDEGYKYAMGQTGGDLREFVKSFNKTLNGRGGGKPFFAQGSVLAKRTEIEKFLKENGIEEKV